MNENVSKTFQLLKQKIIGLIDERNKLKKENERLLEKLQKAQLELNNQQKLLEEKNQLEQAQQFAQRNEQNENKLIKEIDQYIKLIDKSIAKIQSPL